MSMDVEDENRLLKERIKHMERDFALERQQLLNENTEIYGLLGMAHLNLKQHLKYGFNPKTAGSTLKSVGRYAPKLREALAEQEQGDNYYYGNPDKYCRGDERYYANE